MKVRTILEKMGRRVETTSPEADASTAARHMSQMGIGSLVVCDGRGQVEGVLDERILVHAMARHGRMVLDLPVRRLMRNARITCSPDHDLKQVMSLMTHERVRHVVVIDRGELVGVVSIGDVVKQRLEEMELEVNVLRDHARARGSLVRWTRGRV